MNHYVVLDKDTKKKVASYYYERPRYDTYWDLNKYIHYVITDENTSADGYFLNEDMSVGYTEPIKSSDLRPKIYSYVKSAEVRNKHHTEIDFDIELTIPLFMKNTQTRGEVTMRSYYSDEALTDLILYESYSYTRDALGFAVFRDKTITWVNNDESDNPEKKSVRKRYDINRDDSISEGRTRRQNIVDGVQQPCMGAMIETIPGYQQIEILFLGSAFMDSLADELKSFVENSSRISDQSSPDFGRKSVIVAIEQKALTDSPWLNNVSQLLGGQTILAYLSNEFSV